jgi:pyridoxamine 5'-phosphate oxidase
MADPIFKFRRWYGEARNAGVPLADAMALATADRDGRPSVRFVLLKQANEDGFVFFTDGRSRKGRDLARNPRAALCFYWHRTGKQVRIEGRVAPIDDAESDRYWRTRPRESRLAASISSQSAPLTTRSALLKRFERARDDYRGGDGDVPRPGAWRGYRLVPSTIEFWTRGDHRLHHRELFVRARDGWTRSLLQP